MAEAARRTRKRRSGGRGRGSTGPSRGTSRSRRCSRQRVPKEPRRRRAAPGRAARRAAWLPAPSIAVATVAAIEVHHAYAMKVPIITIKPILATSSVFKLLGSLRATSTVDFTVPSRFISVSDQLASCEDRESLNCLEMLLLFCC